MSLVKRGDIWHYDFWFLGRRYVGTTRQTVKADAGICEQEVKRRLRRQSAGRATRRGGAALPGLGRGALPRAPAADDAPGVSGRQPARHPALLG